LSRHNSWLFFNRTQVYIKNPQEIPAKIGFTLLKKKLGFRYLMDVIPLDATLVKGSHGRLSKSKENWPLFITQKSGINSPSTIEPVDVYNLIVKHLMQ
ncbi:hypothetical protein RM529_12930, partial [Zunongwangia sp. F297]|nr:hypothetical protein [Zunongwangia sp. F297]